MRGFLAGNANQIARYTMRLLVFPILAAGFLVASPVHAGKDYPGGGGLGAAPPRAELDDALAPVELDTAPAIAPAVQYGAGTGNSAGGSGSRPTVSSSRGQSAPATTTQGAAPVGTNSVISGVLYPSAVQPTTSSIFGQFFSSAATAPTSAPVGQPAP